MERLIIFILFLQISDLYKLLLIPFGLTTNVFSIFTLLVCIVYIFARIKTVAFLWRKPIFRLWGNYLLIIPFFICTIHLIISNIEFSDYQYWISLLLLFFVLFVSSAIIGVTEKNEKWIKYLVQLSVLAGILSIVIGYVDYNIIKLFISVSANKAEYINSGVESADRSRGFYGQSNVFAKAIVLHFVFLLYFFVREKKLTFLIIGLFLVLVFLTGSRTSLIIYLFVVVACFPLLETKSYKRFISAFRFIFIGVIILVFINQFASFSTSIGLPDLSSRVSFDNTSLQSDHSLNARVETIKKYANEISIYPLIGKGPFYRNYLIETGEFSIGAQNEYLEQALAYGIFFVLFYFFVLLITYTNKSYDNEIKGPIKILCIVIFIYGFSLNHLFLDRVIVIVLGLFLGINYGKKKEKLISNDAISNN